VYGVSNGRKLTPKHIGLGIALHQATGSTALVDLMHAANHTIGIDTVRRIDTSIAQSILQLLHHKLLPVVCSSQGHSWNTQSVLLTSPKFEPYAASPFGSFLLSLFGRTYRVSSQLHPDCYVELVVG